jgi:ankyrin repeat protein
MTVQNRNHARLQELRANEACEFLLAHPNLVEWYRASNTQQLVIFGEMGSGKTVSMAYLVDELNRRNEHQLPRPKICYYYCHDNDTGEIINILSGLTLSLLQQLSGLKKTFHNWYKENQACGIPEPSTNPRLLKEFLESVVVSLDRQLFIAIDGLDECDRSSRRNLLKYFNTLSNKTPRLKILLSSRPEEEILNQLSLIPRIDMESNAGRDIIIVRHTVEERLYYLSKDVSKLVIDTLSRLAKGSAIWSKMAVEFIESRGIRAIEPMRRFLDEMPLPGELSSLYDKLILRNSSNDAENQELATIALKLLAVSSRPLSIQELAWAVALAAAQPKVNTIAALSQLVDHQRIMGLIHPFISRIDYSDLRKRQVRLVHQSVKEYVVQKSSRQQGPATSLRPDQASTYGNTEDLEAFALGICIDYLMLDEVDSTPLFTPEQMAIEELPQDFDLFGDRKSFEYDVNCTWDAWEEDMILYDPTDRGFGEFFVYASSHWLKHLGAVRSQPFPPLTKMESLCQAGSLRIWNWINQNCRPGCAIKPRFEFYSELYDPLSITSLYGSDRLLRDMLSNANFDDDKYLPSTAMGAADQILWWGNLSRLKILFYEGKLGHQLRNLGFFERIIKQWYHTRARHENWEEAFSLVDSVLDTMVEEQWGHDLLATAARSGCMPVVQRLLSKARHNTELRNELLRAPQVLGEAVLGDRLGVVEYILREKGFEAYLEYLNSNGENLLHLASAHCNPEIFRLLAPRLQHHIHQIDNHGDTPLVAIVKSNASSTNRYESARIIFSRNNPADSGHDHERHQKALQVAVQLGEIEMCRLLIAEGRMDPLSALVRGSDGQLILRSEPDMNKEAILKFLLEQRIDSAL